MTMRRTAFVLALTASALLAAGCATDAGSEEMNADDIVGHSFMSGEEGEPFLEFVDDENYRGSDGCNNLTGTYRIDGDAITLRPGLSTLRACPGVDTWVRGAKSVSLDGNTLVVFDKSGSEIGTLARK